VFFSHTKSASAISQPAVLFSYNKSAPATSHNQPNKVSWTQTGPRWINFRIC